MKKVLLFMAVALAAIACEGPQGPQGPKGDDGVANWKIIDLAVNANEWSYSNVDNNNYFSAAFNVPELTDFVYDSGLTQCYIVLNNAGSTSSQQLLPYTRHYEEAVTDTSNNTTWVFYTRTVDYEYTTGKVYIYVTDSDFNYEIDQTWAPDAMNFRLVLMW